MSSRAAVPFASVRSRNAEIVLFFKRHSSDSSFYLPSFCRDARFYAYGFETFEDGVSSTRFSSVSPSFVTVSLTPRTLLFTQGFDEYMNLVLDDAEEVNKKKGTRKTVGRILLKGDNITMMVNTSK